MTFELDQVTDSHSLNKDGDKTLSTNTSYNGVEVGAFQVKYINFIMICVGGGTILLCYFLAVYYGHVPAWLPMISDCAVEAPEKYPFRLGIITTAVMLFVNAYLFYFFLNTYELGGRKELDKVGLLLAGLASFGLAIVGAVNEVENTTLHGGGAIVFFACEMFFMWYCTYRLYADDQTGTVTTSSSLILKGSLTTALTIMLILFALMSTNWGKYSMEIAIEEWIGTFGILIYNFSFCIEFGKKQFIGSYIVPSTPTSAV